LPYSDEGSYSQGSRSRGDEEDQSHVDEGSLSGSRSFLGNDSFTEGSGSRYSGDHSGSNEDDPNSGFIAKNNSSAADFSVMSATPSFACDDEPLDNSDPAVNGNEASDGDISDGDPSLDLHDFEEGASFDRSPSSRAGTVSHASDSGKNDLTPSSHQSNENRSLTEEGGEEDRNDEEYSLEERYLEDQSESQESDMSGEESLASNLSKFMFGDKSKSAHTTTRSPAGSVNGSLDGSVNSRTSRVSRTSSRASHKSMNREKKVFNGYSREQMAKLSSAAQLKPQPRVVNDEDPGESSNANKSPGKKKKKIHRPRIKTKSDALLGLVANVNGAMTALEEGSQWGEGKEADMDSTPRRLLHGFEALVGILLQLSDELELLSTFARQKDASAIDALKALLDFATFLDEQFVELNPILQHYLSEEINDEMNDLLYGLNMVVDLLCELTHRVGEKQEWNPRANTCYATLLELLARDTMEITSCYEDVDTPPYELSMNLERAWEGTGHIDEFQTLRETYDLTMFRQLCYEVMLSTDQWCPDTDTLMDICGIDASMLGETRGKASANDVLAPTPETALQVLEKISGDGLPRTSIFASILRRMVPAHAITDVKLLDSFASIRGTVGNPLGLSPANMVAISSVPEVLNDPNALGLAGVGKTTLAAMVADHEDVRRYFRDGIAWIHIGDQELDYSRYVQCLRDLVLQLNVPEEEEPLFPELLHTPGESKVRRRRREEGFMIYVRETMIDFLQYRNILIILDGVYFEPDLDWFDFPTEPSPEGQPDTSIVVLVTTRCRNLLPAADTVEVDMLNEGEAVELLIQESGELSHSLVAESPETRAVVLECANHPLAVKSVGRWLNLKHATAGVVSSVEEIHDDVVKSMEKILKSGNQDDADMMYEILNMSLSPAINGEPTRVIKFCFAAFVHVLCDRNHISDFALADATPIVPLSIAELLFESLLDLEEEALLQEGSLFHAQKKEAAVLIPEALSALGVLKVIITYPEGGEDKSQNTEGEEKYLQVMHTIQQEYGEFLCREDESLSELVKNAEARWNQSFAKAFLAQTNKWDTVSPDAGLDYALEMLPSHMIRGGMFAESAILLANSSFVRGRLFALGRENGTRRHIKDCEDLFDLLTEQRAMGRKKLDPKSTIKHAYQVLGGLLNMDEDEFISEEGSPEAVEVARAHFEIGFSLAEKRCWDAAITHWETSQELLVSSLGMVEIVAGILYNVGVVYAEMNEYEQALGSLKQCLRIRGAIHGEEHILYAQTIQKIGDIFLCMSDYHEAMESYNWALDVMHIEPSHFRCDIGSILECMGCIHYSKGEVDEALQCFQDALRSKQVDLGEDHPELATTYHYIGNCLSDQGQTEDAIAHFEEAIRLKQLDPDGGDERDSDVLTIEGVLHNLNGRQQEGLEHYEKSLQILVTKVPHRKEKVASLLHLIGCVYLMSGQHKKAMKLFEESLQARRKVLGFVHLDVASTLFNMAFLHQSRNRLDKALKCLEEALKIRQLRLPDSEKVAVTHEKIGKLARSIGKTKKAEIAFVEALRIRKLVHGGENHEAVATVLQEIGDLMDDLGESDEAMKHYVQALNIRQERFGPDDLAVAETLYSMGFTLQHNEASERALHCFEESLNIRRFQLGEDAKEVGDTLNMMGFLQAKRGELDDALSLLWDALRIRKLQDDHVKVSETLKNIGNVHREKQEHDLAVECYEECLRIRRAELGDDHEKVAEALVAIGNVLSDMDHTEDAMGSYKEALMIRTKVFGEHDESVATVLQYMGTLEFRAENLDKALQLLNEFTRIRHENGTKEDGDYVNVLFMIGNIYKMQGEEEEAQKCWKEAYAVFKELGLADGNPQIASVMGNLVKDKSEDDDDEEDEENPEQYQAPQQQSKGMFGKIAEMAEKVKGSGGRGKRKGGKGQQL
jgi:tetratricopeptide (TPR) repeat protein